MDSINVIAIGSSMMASGRRASLARERSVSSAVSDTPVRIVPSALTAGVGALGVFRGIGANLLQRRSAQDFVQRAQVPGGRRRLVALLAHGLADGGVQGAGLAD